MQHHSFCRNFPSYSFTVKKSWSKYGVTLFVNYIDALFTVKVRTWTDDDSSILAFSAASLSLCKAMLSLDKSTPLWNLNSNSMSFRFDDISEKSEFTIAQHWCKDRKTVLINFASRINLSFEFCNEMLKQFVVKVFSAKICVTICGFNLWIKEIS